jgi:oligopeptide/dipeptide ABC transporter ATP-binding protein
VSPEPAGGPLLQLEDVRKHFPQGPALPWTRPRRTVRAVDGISFEVRPHETMSLVGESGCGKTTTARLILLLERPSSGRVSFRGRDITTLDRPALQAYRAQVQAVFQDPWSSLNPRLRGGTIVAEPLVINQHLRGGALRERVGELLQAVGLEPGVARAFPHELSGGMRQRLAVARALGLGPSLVVLDEPVSALDVSVRAQIMNLLRDLQARLGIGYLLIAHNLATVRYLSHRVAVMYVGQIVETATAEELFARPLHPYTQALISAAASIRPGAAYAPIVLGGEVPSPASPPSGCRFHPRCPVAFARCPQEEPALRELAPGHRVACHLY